MREERCEKTGSYRAKNGYTDEGVVCLRGAGEYGKEIGRVGRNAFSTLKFTVILAQEVLFFRIGFMYEVSFV